MLIKNATRMMNKSCKLTAVANGQEAAVEMAAAPKSGGFADGVVGCDAASCFSDCRKSRMVWARAALAQLSVAAAVATFPVELRRVPPSSSNIPHRFWPDCCFPRCRPFPVASVYSPSLCVQLRLLMVTLMSVN